MEFKVDGRAYILDCREEDGITYLQIAREDTECFGVEWECPMVDIYSLWSAGAGAQRSLPPDWSMRTVQSRLAQFMPLLTAVSYTGENRMSVAVSDCMNPIDICAGVNEERAALRVRVRFFTQPTAAVSDYRAVIRIDMRKLPYDKAVQQAAAWWESCGYKPAWVPPGAREPVDSLWYSFHQELEPEQVLRECRASAALGLKTVILDDGWQTDNNNRGYAWCGDWELATSKIPDMAELCRSIHHLGMKLMIWYSVPYVGVHSKAYARFRESLLNPDAPGHCTLDPRYKEVRQYLIEIYTKAVKEWDLDGLKLDFVDAFQLRGEDRPDSRRDCATVEQGADCLMREVYTALTAIKPDIMIEFRQSYVGPCIRQYGNMLRVTDCPNDPMGNRRGVADLRLTSGSTPVHSDMLMWNPQDTPQSVAQQLAGVLFAVPQISVRVDGLPREQYKVLKHYLEFWYAHRQVLLDGSFSADHPETFYSHIRGEKDAEAVLVVYQNPVIWDHIRKLTVVNASDSPVLYIKDRAGDSYQITDCTGALLHIGTVEQSLQELDVPVGGFLELYQHQP